MMAQVVIQAVASSLNISGDNKPTNTSNGTGGFIGKPYLGKPRSSQLGVGIAGSLNPELFAGTPKTLAI